MSHLLTPAERLVVLRANPWFAQLPGDLANWMAANGRPVAFAADRRLFDAGTENGSLFFVVSGAIRAASSSAEGKEALLMFIGPGQWFGETGLFDDAAPAQDASAETDSVLLRWHQSDLHAFLTSHPQHWRSFGRLLAQKLRLALHLIEDIALYAPPVRLASRLIAMAYGYGPWRGTHRRVIEVQQEDLGSMLGMSRQSVNQILKDFQAKGLLSTARGSVELLDMEALKRYVQE